MKNRNVKLLMTLLTGVAIGTAIGAGMGILFLSSALQHPRNFSR
ncbi:hypothetical protein JM83_3552 [Gillisia sp. Hel_I_86]|nr:hypothetical protein JM83_3552 [Gillisia sp. Hel_I_86]